MNARQQGRRSARSLTVSITLGALGVASALGIGAYTAIDAAQGTSTHASDQGSSNSSSASTGSSASSASSSSAGISAGNGSSQTSSSGS